MIGIRGGGWEESGGGEDREVTRRGGQNDVGRDRGCYVGGERNLRRGG